MSETIDDQSCYVLIRDGKFMERVPVEATFTNQLDRANLWGKREHAEVWAQPGDIILPEKDIMNVLHNALQELHKKPKDRW